MKAATPLFLRLRSRDAFYNYVWDGGMNYTLVAKRARDRSDELGIAG